MKDNFKGKSSTPIEIIMKKIQKELMGHEKIGFNKRKTKTPKKIGKLSANEWKKIILGLDLLGRLKDYGIDKQEILISSGEDVSKARFNLVNYKEIIDDFMRRIHNSANDEYEIRKRNENLYDYNQVVQAARDGIILKQVQREEKIDGTVKKITYDTSMTPNEVINILKDYEKQAERMEFNKLHNYLGIGLAIAGIIGTIAKKNVEKKELSIISIGTMVIGAIKLIQGMLKSDDREEQWELRDTQFRLRDNLFKNEQLSREAEKDAINEIIEISDKERKINNKIENKQLIFNGIMDLIVAIISGVYINQKITIKDNGKVDGKSLVSALSSLYSSERIASTLVRSIQGFQNTKKDQIEFDELCEKVKNIVEQMEEKVYPLVGADKSFNSIKIKNFEGNFYPKKNYENDEVNFSSIINIPEFSIKRGDIVLLSGESGAGKSTFLRLLKRGDINNRECIQLDSGKKVDNLGNEWVSFRPSMNLGDEKNVLAEITGKNSISELTNEEKESLIKIMKELKLDKNNLLEELASKNFNEFSTGQQRRLALSKLFYRIDDGKSIIIVDEPVGNVEDSLIREQLELIVKYAKRKNVMLLLTTHRLDLAKDLVTKRYNINKDGLMIEMPVANRDERD